MGRNSASGDQFARHPPTQALVIGVVSNYYQKDYPASKHPSREGIVPKAAPQTPSGKRARKKTSKAGAGYSGTSLVKKLGFKEGFRASFPGEPPGFRSVLGTLPEGAVVSPELKKPLDLILFFTKRKSELQKSFPKFLRKLSPKGMLWIAWPKKSSGVTTDLTFDVVQKAGLGAGLVDTKICAVDETWSGLRFVIRVKDRPASTS